MDFREFLLWERSTRDTIDFKRAYVQMAGDLVAGLMLSQIVFWHLPGPGGETKLRVRHDGHLWICKAHGDWEEEIAITGKQARRALAVLEERGLIIRALYLFGGRQATHIRLHPEGFMVAWDAALGGRVLALEGMVPGLGGSSITETTTETKPEKKQFTWLYEQILGVLVGSRQEVEEMMAWEDDVSVEEFTDACDAAVLQGVRKWVYVKAILERRLRDETDEGGGGGGGDPEGRLTELARQQSGG